jgi:hypothetical protein
MFGRMGLDLRLDDRGLGPTGADTAVHRDPTRLFRPPVRVFQRGNFAHADEPELDAT